MEIQSNGVESEQISDAFVCCVCLDLLYKPVVLVCGHVACFWCVHRSMNGHLESHCPICRHPYNHFPTICQMLHFLLMKMYPMTYKRRENQILEYEKERGCFSPHFNPLVCASHINEEMNCPGDSGQSSATHSQDNLSANPCSTRKGEACANAQQLEFDRSFKETSRTNPKEISTGVFDAYNTVAVEEENFLHHRSSKGTCKQVSIADVLCAACKQLLFRPVVYNCGHVYCETCVFPADEALRCQVCQCPHPRGFPKVFLELDHFLEEQFPTEYVLRRGTAQLKQAHLQHEKPTTCLTEADKQDVYFSFPPEENCLPWWSDRCSKVHFGVGCDFCGMFPIIGDRYRCKDCVEAIGFDLCGDCYNTRSKLPGRFNQQHTPEHRFENVKSSSIHNIMRKLLRGELGIGFAASNVSNGVENPENVFPSASIDAQEDAENGLAAPMAPTNTVDDNLSPM